MLSCSHLHWRLWSASTPCHCRPVDGRKAASRCRPLSALCLFPDGGNCRPHHTHRVRRSHGYHCLSHAVGAAARRGEGAAHGSNTSLVPAVREHDASRWPGPTAHGQGIRKCKPQEQGPHSFAPLATRVGACGRACNCCRRRLCRHWAAGTRQDNYARERFAVQLWVNRVLAMSAPGRRASTQVTIQHGERAFQGPSLGSAPQSAELRQSRRRRRRLGSLQRSWPLGSPLTERPAAPA